MFRTFALGIATLLLGAATPRAALGQDLTSKVDRLFEAWDKPGSPGFVLGIVRDGKLIHHRGYGMADLDHNVPLSKDSVLQAWSMTKTFTTLCFALLLDQGKVGLDDPVTKYVPELPGYEPPITVRHLLQCTSGLHDYYLTMQVAGWHWRDAWTQHDVLDMLRRRKSAPIESGKKFYYSNSDYFLLGLIIERVSGQSLRRFAQEHLFGPLEMTNSFFDDDPAALVKNRATGYERRPDGKYYRSMIQSNTVGAFDLKTTVADLYRWDQNFYANRLKEGPHVKAFLRQGHFDNRRVLEAYPAETYKGLQRNWYTGGGPGFFAQMMRFPEQEFAVIVLSNLAETSEWHALTRNIQQIADLYLADQVKPAPPLARWELKPTLGRVVAGDKAGLFRGDDGLFHKVVYKDQQFWWISPFLHEYPLQALSPTRFRSMRSPMPCDLEFVKGKSDTFTVKISNENGTTAQWHAVKPVAPTAQELAEFAGTYVCQDLATTYAMSMQDGQLVMRINNGSIRTLVPMTRDVFIPANRLHAEWIFTFERGKANAITGFTLDYSRLRGIRFSKER